MKIEDIARKEGITYQAVVKILLFLRYKIDSETLTDEQVKAVRQRQQEKEDWLDNLANL